MLQKHDSVIVPADTVIASTINATDTIKHSFTNSALKDTVQNVTDTTISSTAHSIINHYSIFNPTEFSLSGLGVLIWYKNQAGEIAIALSLLTSLIILIPFKFLRSARRKQYLLLTNILFVTTFVIDSFISKVTLLWGAWMLLALLLIQYLVERKDSRKASG